MYRFHNLEFFFLKANVITINNTIYESKDQSRLSFASKKKFHHCQLNYKILHTKYCSVVIRKLKNIFFSFSIVTSNEYHVDNDYPKHLAKGQLRQQILRGASLNIQRHID